MARTKNTASLNVFATFKRFYPLRAEIINQNNGYRKTSSEGHQNRSHFQKQLNQVLRKEILWRTERHSIDKDDKLWNELILVYFNGL